MTFNTLRFAIFFCIIYLLYRLLKHKWQNILLLVASYLFYCFWDWRFLSLIIASTLVNYYCGLAIDSSPDEKKRKAFLIISIVYNLGILGFFKYFNFFSENLVSLLALFGWHLDAVTLNIILPLGISFYTFQAMTYPIDIYWNLAKPAKKISDFALFVSFFPLVISGPIERAKNLIPQISNERVVTRDKFEEGSWLIFWGLFKKIAIADNLSKITTAVFAANSNIPGSLLLIAGYAFTFQVYADFSGYSDMARGLCRVMGFNVMANFKVPFFSSNLYELWQRWHISLTTWIKEYLFYPLALAKFFGRQLSPYAVILISWAVMGFWHGPYWKFIVWGLYHGILLVIYNKIRPYILRTRPKGGLAQNMWVAGQTIIVFHLFAVGLLFFAAQSTTEVLRILGGIPQGLAFINGAVISSLLITIPAVVSILVFEYFQYKNDDEMVLFKWPILVRAAVYYALFYATVIYGEFSAQQYYYFQF